MDAQKLTPMTESLTGLTVWEAKEQAGLLALETDEWRQKRLIAEDPDTTAEVLEGLVRDIDSDDIASSRPTVNHDANRGKAKALLAEALVAHPNLPPHELIYLLGRVPFPSAAFCRNPIAPFVLLEAPHFVASLRPSSARMTLLRQENLPLALVKAIAMMPRPAPGVSLAEDEEVAEASMHIALAGEIRTLDEGKQQLQTYWRNHAVREGRQFVRSDFSQGWWRDMGQTYWDLYEVGLVPEWLGQPPLVVEPSAHEDLLMPEAEQWLRFDALPNSAEEQALWAKIAPDLPEDTVRFARPDATEKQLLKLIDLQDQRNRSFRPRHRNNVCQVVASHPNTTPRVMNCLLKNEPSGSILRLLTAHPNVPRRVVSKITNSFDAEARRLARRHPLAPSNACALSRAAIRESLDGHEPESASTFELLIGCLNSMLDTKLLTSLGTSCNSTHRLIATLGLPARPVSVVADGVEGCTSVDLLNLLARDGNRVVRWAAQTRLADPDFTFTWHEGNE